MKHDMPGCNTRGAKLWLCAESYLFVSFRNTTPIVCFSLAGHRNRESLPLTSRRIQVKNLTVWRAVGIREKREMIVDFLLAESDFHRTALSRKRAVEWSGLPLPIVTPEDLLILKALGGRLRDQADIEGIKASYGQRLDRKYLASWRRRLGLSFSTCLRGGS